MNKTLVARAKPLVVNLICNMTERESAQKSKAQSDLYCHSRRRKRKMSGFTLIEIMVVMLIVGLMAAFVAPNIFGKKDQADRIKAQADIKQLSTQLALYRLDNYQFPNSSQGLQALVTDPGTSGTWTGYIEKLQKDPWGNDYQYAQPGQRNPNGYDLWSFGADGVQGGEGRNSDIGNWETDQ